jgi:cytochrome c oxidase assembly protein subunit 15
LDLPLARAGEAGESEFPRVARAAKLTLAYTIFVILFGAVVRITGSGAGCGQHWPTCNGEVLHLPRRLETLIELTHRVTSGGALVAVLAFAAMALIDAPRGHRLRRAAYAAVLLMVLEALIGAGLVLFRLVAHDASSARAVVMPAHLLSTYALVAVLTLATRGSRPAGGARTSPRSGSAPGRVWLLCAGLAILVVAATGAVTALGDTLYPPTAASLAGRVVEDQGSAANFLQRLRVLHPVLAVCTAALVMHLAAAYGTSGLGRARGPSRFVIGFAGAQVVAGGLNVLLSAPGWLQVVHLGLALGLWISFVSLASALSEQSVA